MQKVFLKRTKRILAGHLWIFSNELSESPKKYEPGSLVEVYSFNNTFLGIGYINPASLICIRLMTRQREAIDSDFFMQRIKDAYEYRVRFIKDTQSCRVIYSESDLLPGLIVDKYNDALCVQILTLGMQRLSDIFLQCLDDFYKPKAIFLRNESQTRQLEGLSLSKSVYKGDSDFCTIIKEGMAKIEIKPYYGQKTGFFLDQRANRLLFSQFIKKGTIGLDLFSYVGAWGVQAALAGAEVISVDESDYAIAGVRKNAEINNVQGLLSGVNADVFEFLDKLLNDKTKYDFVVVDPPAFAKSRSSINSALKGYCNINAKVMRLLKPSGLLVSSSCSHHIDKDAFLSVLALAAKDAGIKDIRLLYYAQQAIDHPILLNIPETEYLKCAFISTQ